MSAPKTLGASMLGTLSLGRAPAQAWRAIGRQEDVGLEPGLPRSSGGHAVMDPKEEDMDFSHGVRAGKRAALNAAHAGGPDPAATVLEGGRDLRVAS